MFPKINSDDESGAHQVEERDQIQLWNMQYATALHQGW